MDKWILHDLLSKVGISIAILGAAIASFGDFLSFVGAAVAAVGVVFCASSYFSAKSQADDGEADDGNEKK